MISPAAPPMATPPADGPSRDIAFDSYKGIAILAVILHHVSSIGIRQTEPGTTSHLAVVGLNRFLLFCVPAFIFLTVFLLTRSLIRRPAPPVKFWRNRFPRILIPYLFWSLFYIGYHAWDRPGTLEEYQDPQRWVNWLLLGKSYYHLYFLVIILQVYLVLPGWVHAVQSHTRSTRLQHLLLLLAVAGITTLSLETARLTGNPPLLLGIGWAALAGTIYLFIEWFCARGLKARLGLGLWAALAFALQIGAYGLHKIAIQSPYPATFLLSYLLPVLLGLWTAWRWDSFKKRGPIHRWTLAILTLAAFAYFMPPALRVVDELPVDSLHYQATYTVFTSAALFWLFGVALDLSVRWPRLCGILAVPGVHSMELYLIHPAILTQITRHPIQGTPGELALTILVLFLDLTAISLLIAVLLRRIGLGELLFGK
ncbi:MAG: acyltransferase [Armatimonadetes bacterium]|nr:acyltransferase [Armatimonadota bacterium]